MKFKSIFVLLLVLCLLCVSTQAENAEYVAKDGVYEYLKSITFDDMAYMPVNHWSQVAVYTASAAGLIKGYDLNFMPQGTVTRSEALAVLFRSSGEEDIARSYYNNVVKSKQNAPKDYYNNIDSWADGYLRLAVDYGILSTEEYIYSMSSQYKSDGAFPKDKPALKSELAEWIVKVYKLPLQQGETKISKFHDYGQFAENDKKFLETAVYYGILNGSGDKLDPYVTMTREQMAQIFYNIRKLWAPKLGYNVIDTTVIEVKKDSIQETEKITNNISIITENGNLITKKEYKLLGEAVDNTISEGYAYKDFAVIADGHLPTDCTILKKSDVISLFVKDGEVKFILKNKDGILKDFSSSSYKDAGVYKGKLYFFDSGEMTVVIETENGFEEIECTSSTDFSYRTNSVDKEKVNELYKDSDVYVFTCTSTGEDREFAYRVQITD